MAGRIEGVGSFKWAVGSGLADILIMQNFVYEL